MNNIKSVISLWKNIFKQKKYYLILSITAIALYIITVLLFQLRYLTISSLEHPVLLLFSGFYNFVPRWTFYSTIVICFLTGMLFSLLSYRFDNLKQASNEKISWLSSIGIFLGVAAPGCASCGVGLAVALGLGSTIAKLPFHGMEISLFAMLILMLSVWRTSLSFVSCKVTN